MHGIMRSETTETIITQTFNQECKRRDKVFKNGPSKICGRQPLKNLKGYGLLLFKGCIPQILLGLFLNTLSKTAFVQKLLFAQNFTKI